MPFVNRHASPFPPPKAGLMKSHPFVFTTTAAAAGVLLGGFVAVQLLGTPAKQDAGAKPAQLALQAKAPPHIADVPSQSAETMGSGSSDVVAAVDCSKQTWPNLSRECLKNGGAVAPADKPVAPSIAPVAASTAASGNSPPLVAPPIASTAAAEPAQAPAAAIAPAPVQAAEKPDARPKQVAKKVKHKAKKPEKQELNNDDEDRTAVASDDSDDRIDRADRRLDRTRHVSTRWSERDYDVPDDEGVGRRRVVIRRGGGGGPFGALFGGFRDDDD